MASLFRMITDACSGSVTVDDCQPVRRSDHHRIHFAARRSIRHCHGGQAFIPVVSNDHWPALCTAVQRLLVLVLAFGFAAHYMIRDIIVNSQTEENAMNSKRTAILMMGLALLTGCNIFNPAAPTPTPLPTAPLIFLPTETPAVLPTAIPTSLFTPTATPIPPVAANVCNDPQAIALIDSLKSSMLNANGASFSPLVSPNGMEVRYFRDGNVIKYTAHQ